MTRQEFDLWEAANLRGATPCFDCTAEFHKAMKAQDKCDDRPRNTGLPPKPGDYETLRRRKQWRDAKRRYLARRAA